MMMHIGPHLVDSVQYVVWHALAHQPALHHAGLAALARATGLHPVMISIALRTLERLGLVRCLEGDVYVAVAPTLDDDPGAPG